MPTPATPANMRTFAERNPSRTIDTPYGPAIIEGRRCFAVSTTDPDERCSASAGDYWALPDDRPLIDTCGDPMVLAVERCLLTDALTDEPI